MKSLEKLKKEIQSVVDVFKSGNLSEAEKLSKKLISSNPKIVFLYNLLGLIYYEQKKIDLAAKYYEKAISIDPKFAMAYNNLALVYVNYKNDYNKGEELYKRAISLDENIQEAHNNLGSLYNTLNKLHEAVDCFKKAISINPKSSLPYHNLGNAYVATGNLESARKNFEDSIKLNPNYTNSHRSLSRLTKYTKGNKHLKELEKLYKKRDVKDMENISFSLGKAYEDLNDYKKSFYYYNEANTLCRKKINFSISEEKEKFNIIKKIFDKEVFEIYNDSGSNDNSIIFILGMPRSGTTLIEQIISNHPRVYGGDELNFIPNLIKTNFAMDKSADSLKKNLKFHRDLFKKVGETYISKAMEISNNSEKITDKLPENFLAIGFIKLILPKSKIVHCYRNSKDNCISLFKNYFPNKRMNFSFNINDTVQYYNFYQDLMNHWNLAIPNFIFNVKYENLIQNTEIEVKKLLKYCDLEWSDNCLNFHTNKRPIKTASDIQARKKIYKSSVGAFVNYEKYMSDALKKLI